MQPELESEAFYPSGSPAPAAQRSFLIAAADPAWRFGLVLFGLGWAGILLQASFFQQVVIGAPLFEEPAKVGLPIALAAVLGIGAMWARLPIAGAFGAGFGVLEHFLTYADEDPFSLWIRISFHALSTMLSMAAWTALEPEADLRLRWTTTVPSTILHYANNLVAVVLGSAALALPVLERVASGWSLFATILLALATVAVALRPRGFREGMTSLARRFVPALRA